MGERKSGQENRLGVKKISKRLILYMPRVKKDKVEESKPFEQLLWAAADKLRKKY